jgi:PPK2 family polyphosphate:nucleotide phosphotransferase
MSDPHQLNPNHPVRLLQQSSNGKQFYSDKKAAIVEFRDLRDELIELQRRLYAEDKHRVLIVFQAMDAGGKDGTIRRIFRGVNPQGVRVSSFKVPSKLELAHDFLWRVHKIVPKRGMIGVFNRSHYEDVLVVRVHEIVPESVWRPRYELINQFEKLLASTGTKILKFYLHISKDEQRTRFQDRINEPEKNWKFSFEDLKKREMWDSYMLAYEDMLANTGTTWAPWYLIPSDQKWYRNLAVTRAIVQALRTLDPHYPEPDTDLSGIIVE